MNGAAPEPRSLDALSAIKVIGLGGVGVPVAQALAQYLASARATCPLYLIDGDRYEERNRKRVLFQSYENKALSKAEELSAACEGRLTLLPVPDYVNPENVARIIEEGDCIFLCVDNHATRKLVSDRCSELEEVTLFSGGNDGIEEGHTGTFGNVQIYLRESGIDRTNSLTRFHPEIAKPRDQRPDEVGCAALATSAPQILFTNLAVASAMLGAFYWWLQGGLNAGEIYLDILQARMTPIVRAVTESPRSCTPSGNASDSPRQ